jgi:hypothetical protein
VAARASWPLHVATWSRLIATLREDRAPRARVERCEKDIAQLKSRLPDA